MKKLIFCLIAFIATFVVASARDVGVKLQTDIPVTYTVPTMQHSDLCVLVAMVKVEAPPGTAFTPTNYTAINQMETQLAQPPTYCNPDYGSYAQVSVTNQLITNKRINTKAYTHNRICTARHVFN